jgi:hypothetical protein
VTRSFKKVETQFSATPRLRANGHLVASIVIRRCALAVGIAVLAACAGREEASRPPNVIVVLVDDLRRRRSTGWRGKVRTS